MSKNRLASWAKVLRRLAQLYLANFGAGIVQRPNLVTLDDSNTHGRYINLDYRVDRRVATEEELSRMNLPFVFRHPGSANTNGALGCAIAHFGALSEALLASKDYALIAEDDVVLSGDSTRLLAVLEAFLQNDSLDVLCVGNRTRGIRIPAGDKLHIAFDIQTTSLYVAKRRALPSLIASASKSIFLLGKGIAPKHAAIDILWKERQVTDLVFCVPREKIVVQRPSHSDVVGKFKNYGD